MDKRRISMLSKSNYLLYFCMVKLRKECNLLEMSVG